MQTHLFIDAAASIYRWPHLFADAAASIYRWPHLFIDAATSINRWPHLFIDGQSRPGANPRNPGFEGNPRNSLFEGNPRANLPEEPGARVQSGLGTRKSGESQHISNLLHKRSKDPKAKPNWGKR